MIPDWQTNELILLLFQITLILAVSRGLTHWMRRLGQPTVIAEIIAGIMLGPSVLGWLSPGIFTAVFSPESLHGLRSLSQIGLVFFMFLVGLEVDPKLLRGRIYIPTFIGTASTAVSLLFGLICASWLYYYYNLNVKWFSFVGFVSLAISMTAFPVMARILSERRLLGTQIGVLAIACAAVGDIFILGLISLLFSANRLDSWPAAFYQISLGILILSVTFLSLRPILNRWINRMIRHGVGSNELAWLLLLLLLFTGFSELLGINALLGAFLFGAMLPKENVLIEAVLERLEVFVLALLLPLFFAYSGLRTQIMLLESAQDWLVLAVVLIIAIIAKVGAGASLGKLAGLKWREASAIGVLLNTRGLMGLIVLNAGLDLEIISPTIFTMLVIVFFITTLMTSPLLRWLYPNQRMIDERFLPFKDATNTPIHTTSHSTPPPETAQPELFLACVSDPRSGPSLALLAHNLACTTQPAACLLGVHLSQPVDRASAAFQDTSNETLDVLAPFLACAKQLDVDTRSLSFVSTIPAQDILRIAETRRASWILLGAHEPVFFQGPLDGVVRDVIRGASTTVCTLVTKPDHELVPQTSLRVLIGYTGHEDDAVLEILQRLATRAQVTLFAVNISDDSASEITNTINCELHQTQHPSPPDAMADFTDQHCYDLIVIPHNSTWCSRVISLGKTKNSIFTRIHKPILVVHKPVSS